jgi:O-antigen biosynthesis protein
VAIPSTQLPPNISVSVVVATLDRPADLRSCIRCLVAQVSHRTVEIIVVDNNPSSGLTPPVVAEFPGVRLVDEPRRGLAYARNRGFVMSHGSISATNDLSHLET